MASSLSIAIYIYFTLLPVLFWRADRDFFVDRDLTCFISCCCRYCFGEQTGLDQYAIKKFAEALEVVPRILSETSGQDAEKVFIVHETAVC